MEILLTWAALTIVIYCIYIVAIVYESRRPSLKIFDKHHMPIWRYQSRAFLPGDAGLALFVAAAPKSFSWTFAVAGAVACLIALWVIRNVTYDKNGDDYDLAAWNSPSKRYHDYVVCFVLAFTATVWWSPILLQQMHISAQALMIGIAGLSVWLAGLLWDGIKKQVPNKFQHPTEYHPFLWFRGSSNRRT
ncbi:MAG: hypothetical protein EOP06_10375 [Proteobacteria bacterium]|nr:MAG: hypothetical protein EOP06_10375 [Pseudomonadota bacterium]